MTQEPPSPYECIKVGNGILCDADSILQTWYNQKHMFTAKQTHVVVGCLGTYKNKHDCITWIRGKTRGDNCMDIYDHAIIRNKETGKVEKLHLYTWLEDDEGNVYDIPKPEWTVGKKLSVINGLKKEAIYGLVYRQFGKELEQKYTLMELKKIYGDVEFSDELPPIFHT
jgi:hypothetical protein